MWSKHHSVKLDGSSDMDRLPPARHTIKTLCTQPQGFDTLPVTTLIFKPFGLPPGVHDLSKCKRFRPQL